MIQLFQLSTQQKHVWLLQQGEPYLPYRTQGAVFIEGNLDIETLKIALDTVINRHEILRTTFKRYPGEMIPSQAIIDSNLPAIYLQDLSDLTSSAQEIAIAANWQKFSQLDCDFTKAPNLDVLLIILSPQKHLLILSLPSLCADSVTLKNLVEEISYYYGGLPKEQLPPAPMQYADYAEWQHELLAAEDTKIGLDYWRKQDISLMFNLKLPGENQSDQSQEFQPKSIAVTIDPDKVGKLEIILRQYETSISVFLQSIWHIWLWRLTGQSNLIVGMGYDGRQYEELQQSVGFSSKTGATCPQLSKNNNCKHICEQIHNRGFP